MLRIMFGCQSGFRWGAVLAAVVLLSGVGRATAWAKDSEAEAAYEAAAGLFNLGLWEQAAKAYKEYFKKYPRHSLAGHAHFGLGLCHFNMKEYAGAATQLKAAAAVKGPDKVEANLYLGQALLMKAPAEPGNAEDAFEVALKTLGFSKQGIIQRTWNGKSVKEWVEKKENEKPKQRELASDVFVGLLEATYLQGEWSSVVRKTEAFDPLLQGSPVEQRVRVLTGEAHAKSKDYKKAAEAYEAAAKLEGTDAPEALFRLGLIRLNHLKLFEAAAKDFHTFAEQYKKDAKQPDAVFNEALCYYHGYYSGQKPHLAKAVDLFGGFAKAHPKHPMASTARFYTGKLEHIREEWRAAVNALEPLMKEKDADFPQLVFLVADSYHRLKDWKKSAELYMQFAKGNEKALNADVALHNAGVSYSNLEKPDLEQAVAAYNLLDSKCPGSPHLPSARLKLGIIHYQAGRFVEARKPLGKIPGDHILKADGDYYLAWADLDDRKPQEAADRFEALGTRLAEDNGQHRLIPLCNLYQGIAEFEGRQFGDSEKTLAKFVADFPKHEKLDEAAFNMGLARMELRKWVEAIEGFEMVPVGSGIHDRALYQAAWSQRLAAKPAEAVPYYKKLLEQHANSPLANNVALELAEVEFETGGEDGGVDSVKRLETLLAKKPAPNAELRRLAQYRLGIVQFSRKDYRESAGAFESLLEDPAPDLTIPAAWQAAEARRQLSLTAEGAARAREQKAALKNYETAMNAEPSETDPGQVRLQQQSLLRLGQMKAAMELWVESQKSFDAFIAAHPRHELIRTAHLGLGWTCQNLEEYPKAIASYEKTVADGIRDDAGARAQFLLGECYLEKKNYDKAIIEYAKVESLYAFPQWQSKAAYELAQALLRKENREGARKQLERLIERYPDTKAAEAAKAELKLIK